MPDIDLANYEPVEERIVRFKAEHPRFRVLTEEQHDGEIGASRWIVKASIWRDSENTGMPDATGYAFEIDGKGMTQRTAALETCETSAIGRALANLGYAGNRRVTREEAAKVAAAELIEKISVAADEAALKALWEEASGLGLANYVKAAVNRRKAEVAS